MADASRHEDDQVPLRLDAFDITARARSISGPEGRLALPQVAHWPIFPFEVDNLQVRRLEDPVLPEPPRRDETRQDCSTCQSDDENFLWSNERWRVRMSQEPLSLPAVVLHSREHLDFDAVTDDLAAEMGVLLVRIQRALASIEGVERVHVYKWGDGGAHLHISVMARPAGMMQLRGMFLSTWLYTLPPLGEDLWSAIRLHVRTKLEDGR